MVTETSFNKNITDLRNLEDGWLDGDGKAPSKELLDWFENWFLTSSRLTKKAPFPYVFPEFNGGLFLEWFLPRFQPSLEIDASGNTAEFMCLDPDCENEWIVLDVDLTDPEDDEWIETLGRAFNKGDM